MSKRFAVIAVNLAAVFILIGGTTAFAAMNKVVAISVDGEVKQIRTYATTVESVLEAQGITLTKVDQVSPKLSEFIGGGQTISIRYGKPIALSVDGEVIRETVYDRTVGDLLKRLDVTVQPGAFISHAEDELLARTGQGIYISNPKTVRVTVDGKTQTVTTTAPSPLYLFRELNVDFDADDEAQPAMTSGLKPNARVTLLRIEKVKKTEEVPTDFEVEYKDDPKIYKGETKVLTAGVPGKAREEVELVLVNGKVRDRKVLKSTPLADAKSQIEARGTKPLPDVWDRLAKCESGGNWKINTGNGYYGGLQFSLSSWRAVGGKGYPHEATKEEQIKRAMMLKKNGGWGHWPACSKKLGLR